MTATIKFDFTHYLPNQDPNSTIVKLSEGQCVPNNFVMGVVCTNLVPGNEYQISYQLLNPSSNPGNPINIFNPPIQNIYASFATQKFATLADLDVQGEYILQATLKDMETDVQTSAIVSLQCGDPAAPTPTPTMTPTITPSRFSRQNNVSVSIVDPDFDPIPDNVVTLGSGIHEFPLIGLAANAIIGNKYAYEFIDVPANTVVFEKKTGEFYAGSLTQNFNSKISFSGLPQYTYIYATVKDIETNVTKYSEPTLFKYVGSGVACSTILPSGLDLKLGAPAFRTCNARGLTTESISFISGGSGFSIGDTLTTVGGGGYGAELEVVSGGITADSFSSFVGGTGFNIGDYLEVTGGGGSGGLIQIVSGGITAESITSLTGSTGFHVGDLLTTVGGGGSGAVIRVTSVNPVTGAILTFEVLNGGSGYTFAPSGLVAITGNGTVTNVVFNADNFSISAAGGITNESITLSGGSGYNIGEILNVDGGGGSGAQIQIISGALTTLSVNSLGGGTGYAVGDYLTTTGGNGEGVVIKVTSIGANGTITGWEIINGGYGFTGAPTGLVALTGTGTGAVISANADNFAIPDAGQITESSISNLIGFGTGYAVGDRLIISGGGGSGAVIEITAVGPNGQILDYVIIDGGAGYSSTPVVLNENGIPIAIQPTWNIAEFTKPAFVIIDAGSGYYSAPTVISSSNGNGTGATATFNVEEFTEPCFVVINSGSGYTSAPTGLQVLTGDGEGFSVTFNNSQFTIPATGGITPASIELSGGTGYNIGDRLSIEGGGGTGAIVEIISGSLTTASINSITGGTGYTVGDYLTTVGGGGEGVVIRVTSVGTNGIITGWELVSGGYGFTSNPTGLVALTGHGTSAVLVANDDNFSITPQGGITEESLMLDGGTGYNIGEKINISGGGGSGAQIEIISGSLSTASIDSIIGGTGYAVGDLLTTTGGDGEGVVIRVTSIGANGSITGWVLVNSGYGFTSAPTGLVALTGSGSGASLVANSDNFALTEAGGITKDSISGLIGTSNAPAYIVGTQLYITGGGGSGAIIRITSVDNTGKILDYVILDAGSGYDGSAPFVVKINSLTGLAIITQPVFDVTQFTDNSFIILNQGSGYESAPTTLTSTNGNGSGAVAVYDVAAFTDPAFVIIDSGSGYTSEPTTIRTIVGNGTGVSASFNVEEFSEPAIIVTNPGSGYQDSPTGLSVLTGYGVISTVEVEFNDNNFIEISGPLPTPTVTPTLTPTPTMSMPAPCNDLQTAGGQNDIYLISTARPAPSGQNFLIVNDSPALALYTVVVGTSIPTDTYITNVENFYSSVSDESNLKKINLNRTITADIPASTDLTAYTVDVRIIKTSYWPGNMVFTYDAYNVPDRFKVIGIPVDKSRPEVLLFDSGFRGSMTCGYATVLSGTGAGSVNIFKPDGMIYVKVIVEAPCEGTAWEYLLACPNRTPLLSPTPTQSVTPTRTPQP